MALLVHGSQIAGAGQVASHAVSTVTAYTPALCSIVIHLFGQPVGEAGIGRGGMAGIAVQTAGDRRGNVVAYLAVGSQSTLRRISTVVA